MISSLVNHGKISLLVRSKNVIAALRPLIKRRNVTDFNQRSTNNYE